MGCQAQAVIGDNLTFSVTTHDPDTGVLTDADAVPAYRIYEDETAVPLLTGNMAKLDDANTTGFYSEQIAFTVANGFENGKSYTVYIVATVDGDTGGISYGVQAVTVPTVTATTISGISANDVTVLRGDTWVITITGMGDLTGYTNIWFTIKTSPVRDTDAEAVVMIDTTTGLLVVNGANAVARAANGAIAIDDLVAGDITVTVDEAETDDVEPNKLDYDVQTLIGGVVTTRAEGAFTISADVTRAIA
jgi:hypothetical protein